MTIAFDIDGTITFDPDAFNRAAIVFQDVG